MLARSRAGTVAIALLLPLTAAFSVAAVQPAQALPAPVVVKTLLTDVDGDKTYDTVQLIDLGSDQYRLTVITTKAITSSVDFTSELASGMTVTDVLYGAVTLDGVKGSELIVRLWNREQLAYRVDVDLAVYTWRSGSLGLERAPSSTYVKGWHLGGQSYHVFDKHGRRYVDVTRLTEKGRRLVGKVTRSVWKKGRWVKVYTRSTSRSRTTELPWYNGPPVLLGQANADFDGDGAADEFRYYRYVDNGWGTKAKVKVTTAKGLVVNKILPYELMVGAAALDGVAGVELVFLEDSLDGTYQVLTWRKGKLVYEAAPGKSGSKAEDDYWMGCGDESGTTFTFSTFDRSRHVVRTCTGEDLNTGDPLTYSSEYVWRAEKWAFLSSREGRPTAEEDAALGRGIQGVTFIKP